MKVFVQYKLSPRLADYYLFIVVIISDMKIRRKEKKWKVVILFTINADELTNNKKLSRSLRAILKEERKRNRPIHRYSKSHGWVDSEEFDVWILQLKCDKKISGDSQASIGS